MQHRRFTRLVVQMGVIVALVWALWLIAGYFGRHVNPLSVLFVIVAIGVLYGAALYDRV